MTDTVAEEWFQRGSRDLAVAKLLIDEEEYLDAAIFHIHQAVEKYLKGFLISHKWELKKVHDLEFLITEAMKHERRLKKHLDLGRKLTGLYFEERYPPGPMTALSLEETTKLLDEAEVLIQLLES